jgi:membrane-associated protease RseP (regulator of RpoE activity)
MLVVPLLLFFLAPSLATVAVVRWGAATALGMRGVHLAFSGSIQNPEATAPWRRALVVLAAVLASYCIPAGASTVAAFAEGRITTEIRVMAGTPAALAGLDTGDRVVSVAGTPVASWDPIPGLVAAHTGEPVEVVVTRAGAERRFTITPEGPPGHGKIGIATAGKHEPIGVVAALGKGLTGPILVLAGVAATVRDILSGGASPELSGPVAIVRATAAATGTTVGGVLTMLAALVAYVWPVAALVALTTAPRPARTTAAPPR